MDKMTVQFALVLAVYAISFGIMYGLSALLPSLADTLFGFNFLIGVILTVPAKAILNKLYDKKVIQKRIVNNYMMDRISGFAFDLMIVAGVAAIQLPLLATYWHVLLILAVLGTVLTFWYVNLVSKKLFPSYRHEQFLAFFGMLTGTASTGMILLREIDGSYRTPHRVRLSADVFGAICGNERSGGADNLHCRWSGIRRTEYRFIPPVCIQKTVCCTRRNGRC